MAIRHRLFAALYDRMNAAAERRWMGKRRADLLADARGVVLEIGGGTGANLPYYRDDVERLVIADPDPFMRRKLWPKLEQARVPVEVSGADAQRLPFADDNFDTVVSTLALCTVPHPHVALTEIRRVLRAGGMMLFIEHVRGEGKVARWQDRIEPVWSYLLAGCHPNRNTVANIEEAGFRVEELERFEPPVPLSSIAPHIQAAAYPAKGGEA